MRRAGPVVTLVAGLVSAQLAFGSLTPTVTTLVPDRGSCSLGSPVNLTATVGSSALNSTVTFLDGVTAIGSVPVAGGTAVLRTTIASAGPHMLRARFNGDSNNASSYSSVITITINPAPTSGFGPALSLPAGSGVEAVATADLNGDGIADLVAANSTDGSVTVLLGRTDGTFQAGTVITGIPDAANIAIADLNGDGFQDLVVTNLAQVAVYLGFGNGTFATPTLLSTTILPFAIALGDFNGDGFVDILVSDIADESCDLYPGSGDGTFGAAQNSLLGDDIVYMQAADVNGDGIADAIFVYGDFSQIAVALGSPSGLGTPVLLNAGLHPNTLAAADFNGDGQIDLAVANGDDTVSLLLGNGDGSFQPQVVIHSGLIANSYLIAATDVNGDGTLDLIVTDWQSGQVSTLIGNGDGTFQPPANFSYSGEARAMALAASPRTNAMSVVLTDTDQDVLNVYPANPASLSVIEGDVQSIASGSTATSPLKVQLSAFGAPLPVGGILIQFAAPASGPAGFFANAGLAVTIATAADGSATAPAFTANDAAGAYTVQASIASGSVAFHLTNAASASNGATCTFLISQGEVVFPSTAAQFAITVTPSAPGCTWAASSNSSWFTVDPAPVTGIGSVNLIALSNPGESPRSGSVLIAGQSVHVTQWSANPVAADLPPSAYYTAAATDFLGFGISTGCLASPLQFCPNENATRAQMAVFVVRSIFGGDNFPYSLTPHFADVPVDAFGFAWIQALSEMKITTGCGPQLFCPNANLTRAEAAVFIVRARLGATVSFTYPAGAYFTDVPTDYWAFTWIQRMRLENITTGCGTVMFCPDQLITRADLAVLLLRGVLNLQLPANTPALTTVSAAVLTPNATSAITIGGVNTHFDGTTALAPMPGIVIGRVSVWSPTSLTVQLSPDPASPQIYPATLVAKTGSEQAVLPNALVP